MINGTKMELNIPADHRKLFDGLLITLYLFVFVFLIAAFGEICWYTLR